MKKISYENWHSGTRPQKKLIKRNNFTHRILLDFVERYILKNQYIFLFLVAFKSISYWLISWLTHPPEHLSTIAMYRIGDIQHYPLIDRFSRLDFGEPTLFELKSTGIVSYFKS